MSAPESTPLMVVALLRDAAEYITIVGGRALLHLGASSILQLPYGTNWAHLAQQEHEAARRWTIVRDRGGCSSDVEITRALRVTELVDVHHLLGLAYEVLDDYERTHAPPTTRSDYDHSSTA